MSYSHVWQVNSVPGSPAALAALAAAQQCSLENVSGTLAVFFYYDGVRHAAVDASEGEPWAQLARQRGVVLSLCRSAWQRRYTNLPRAEFHLGSLTDLALWVEGASEYRCFGGGAE